jgi:enoyl-CoA hydratase
VTTTVVDDGKVCVATIDDGKANALSFDVIAQLRDALSSAVDQQQTFVIAGRDGYFCAGFDLTVMTGGDKKQVSALLGAGADLLREMVLAPVPVVAAVTGHALAAGALILLSADDRIGPSAPCKIGLNEVRINMALPRFACTLARHRIPSHHLSAATMFAEVAGPQRALEMGYLDTLSDTVTDTALARAVAHAALPHEPFAVTKKRIRAGLVSEFEALVS